MISLIRLVAIASLAVSFVEGAFVVRGEGAPDMDSMMAAAAAIDQKSGPPVDLPPPDLPPSKTLVTAVDGAPVNSTVEAVAASGVTVNRRHKARRGYGNLLNHRRHLSRRADVPYGIQDSKYDLVFDGSTDGQDGSIQGTAYLTYTVVDNSTYSVQQCLDFCDRVQDCVFVNLYYEFNNPLLDFVFSEKSNLKCAAYADIHIATEKTNKGGQQLEDPPAGLTYITNSTGWVLKTLPEPDIPEGYQKSFGPIGTGASNAEAYMGFVFLDRYDVQACANLCNARDPHPEHGNCKFFNIWRAEVNSIATTYTCSMYAEVAYEDTAINYGQGDLKVTYSRGYALKSALPQICRSN